MLFHPGGRRVQQSPPPHLQSARQGLRAVLVGGADPRQEGTLHGTRPLLRRHRDAQSQPGGTVRQDPGCCRVPLPG